MDSVDMVSIINTSQCFSLFLLNKSTFLNGGRVVFKGRINKPYGKKILASQQHSEDKE